MFVLLKKNSNESESRPLDIQNLKDKLMCSLVGRKESESSKEWWGRRKSGMRLDVWMDRWWKKFDWTK